MRPVLTPESLEIRVGSRIPGSNHLNGSSLPSGSLAAASRAAYRVFDIDRTRYRVTVQRIPPHSVHIPHCNSPVGASARIRLRFRDRGSDRPTCRNGVPGPAAPRGERTGSIELGAGVGGESRRATVEAELRIDAVWSSGCPGGRGTLSGSQTHVWPGAGWWG